MTIGDMLRRMDAREYTSWAAYNQIEPIGPPGDYWRAALVASTIANVNRGKRHPFKISDFMPQEKPTTPDAREQFQTWFGHRVKRRRRGKVKRSRSSNPSDARGQRAAGKGSPQG